MTDSTPQLPVPVSQGPQRPARLWPLWLLLGITFIALMALALWNWQQWQIQQQLAERMEQIQLDSRTALQRDQQSLSEHRERLRAMENRLQDQRELLATQQRQIDHNATELLNAGFRNRTDWLLAESEYLLRVANQRLLIEKDIRGALAALQAADEVLRDTDDIGVYPVREQLAREILSLRSVTEVDRTGLYLQLEALRESVTQLTDESLIRERAPGFTGLSAANAGSADTASGQDQTLWRRGWQSLRDGLANVIVVRRMDTPVQPLMSPEQSAWARLNLQLMLEQAELAVLRGHPVLYQQALGKASDALNTWYDQSDERVEGLRSGIEELRERDIDPVLPDISQSLSLLKGRLAGRAPQQDGQQSGADAGSDEGSDDS